MIKGQIFTANGVIYSAQCFMAEDFHNVDTLEEASKFDPLVKNFEFGGWSSIREVTAFETSNMQPITNDMVINRLAKKNQTAANDLILKQARLQTCFNEYHDLGDWRGVGDSTMRIKSKHFTDARNRALLNFTW